MIRIITARDEALTPTAWDDYRQVQTDEVSALLGLRFDRELVELAALGVDFGVRRWTEAEWRIRRLAAEAVATLGTLDHPADLDEWMVAQPDYQLSVQVAVWAAVNCGGGSMTLRQVLELAPRDVLTLGEDADYLPGDPEPEASEGKA
jgi:hypothetical protein